MSTESVPPNILKKWRKIFHYRDTDNDGFVTEQDYINYVEHLVRVYGKRAEPAREIAKVIWETFTPRGYTPRVTEEEFLDTYAYLYKRDMKWLREKLERYCHLTFDVIDVNGDGEISVDEYALYQTSFGIHNRDYIEHIFHQMDTDGNGTISRKEFVDEIMDYTFTDKPERIPEMYDDYQAKNFKK